MKFNLVRMTLLVLLVLFAGVSIYVPEGIKAREENRKEKILASIFQGRPVVLEYTSPECATCAAMRPIVQKLKKEYSGAVDFVEVTVQSDQAQALQEMFPAEYLPSFFLCLDRDTVFTHFEGELSEDSFRAMLDSMKSAPRNIIN